MCHYEVVAKDPLLEVASLRTRPLSCATHTTATSQENIRSPCTWSTTSTRMDKYPHAEFTNFMNEHLSQFSANDRILRGPIYTVCAQFCVASLS